MVDLVHEWVRRHKRLQNYMAAVRELNLTPQEKYAYQHHLSNLDRGGVQDSGGNETSTYLSLGVTIGDRYYMLPAVWDNQIVSTPEAVQRAQAIGLARWPSYGSPQEGEARYAQMHRYMERDLNANPISQPARNNNPGAVDQRPQPTGPPWKPR